MPFVIWVKGLEGRWPGPGHSTESSCPLPCLAPSPITIGHDLVSKGPKPDAISSTQGQSGGGTTAACNDGESSQTDSRKQQHDCLQNGSLLSNPSSLPVPTPSESKQGKLRDGQRIIDTFTNFSDSVHGLRRNSNEAIKFRTINQLASPNARNVRLPSFDKRKIRPEGMNTGSPTCYTHRVGGSVFVCDESGRIRAPPSFRSKVTFSRYPPSTKPFCRSWMPDPKLAVPTALEEADPVPCRDGSSLSEQESTFDDELLAHLYELLEDKDVRGQRSGLQPYVEDECQASQSYGRPTAKHAEHRTEGKTPAAVPARQEKKPFQDILSQPPQRVSSAESLTASTGHQSSARSGSADIAPELHKAKIEDMEYRQKEHIEEIRSLLKTWNAANLTELVANADESSAKEVDKEDKAMRMKRAKAYCRAFLRKARGLGLPIKGIWELPIQSRVERITALFQDAILAEKDGGKEDDDEALPKNFEIADEDSRVDIDYILVEEDWELLE